MADHLAEQIVAWVAEKLDGLTTTGSNVFRGQTHPIAEGNLPAISVYMGPDEEMQDLNTVQDMQLAVILKFSSKLKEQALETQLAQIRKEVHVKLRAEFANKLAEVQDYREAETGQPDFEEGSNLPIGIMLVSWSFDYRRSYDDPSI
jgi:hypothetical protein